MGKNSCVTFYSNKPYLSQNDSKTILSFSLQIFSLCRQLHRFSLSSSDRERRFDPWSAAPSVPALVPFGFSLLVLYFASVVFRLPFVFDHTTRLDRALLPSYILAEIGSWRSFLWVVLWAFGWFWDRSVFMCLFRFRGQEGGSDDFLFGVARRRDGVSIIGQPLFLSLVGNDIFAEYLC